MNDLRWILLVAGLLLLAGIYAWGVRARRRAAAPERERMSRVEPARTVPVVPERAEAEPELPADDAPDAPQDAPAMRMPEPTPAGRREPRIEPRFDAAFDDAPPAVRAEPRLEPRMEPAAEAAAGPPATARRAPEAEERRASPPPAPPPPRKTAAQKIVAVRIVAAAGASIAGERLLEALQADGFSFGRYQIFHRLDDKGRPLVSLASLKEPGTFDPTAMPGAQFRGVALFTVMPGPLADLQAFDELIVTARALAGTLDGQLQDERGAPLSLQRIGRLREEVAEFERARGAPPDA